MKLFPAAIVLLVSVGLGQVLGRALVQEDDLAGEQSTEGFSSLEVQDIARQHALELMRSREEQNQVEGKGAQDLEDASSALRQKVTLMEEILSRTEKVLDGLESSLESGQDPGEQVVLMRSMAQLNDPLALGRILIQARELEVRRRGLQLLQKAALNGEREAIDLLLEAVRESDEDYVRWVVMTLTTIARRVNTKEVLDVLRAAGLDRWLEEYWARGEATTERRNLRWGLLAFRTPSAVQAWQQEFDAEGNSVRVRAVDAVNLRILGHPEASARLFAELSEQLVGDDRGRIGSVLNALTRLGTPGGDRIRQFMETTTDARLKEIAERALSTWKNGNAARRRYTEALGYPVPDKP